MEKHFVRIVKDGTLATEGGWLTGICELNDAVFFVAEESAMADEEVVNEAWSSVKRLVIEQAVRDGIVEYAKPPLRAVPSEERRPGWRAAVD